MAYICLNSMAEVGFRLFVLHKIPNDKRHTNTKTKRRKKDDPCTFANLRETLVALTQFHEAVNPTRSEQAAHRKQDDARGVVFLRL